MTWTIAIVNTPTPAPSYSQFLALEVVGGLMLSLRISFTDGLQTRSSWPWLVGGAMRGMIVAPAGHQSLKKRVKRTPAGHQSLKK